jgi:hypothetical protein
LLICRFKTTFFPGPPDSPPDLVPRSLKFFPLSINRLKTNDRHCRRLARQLLYLDHPATAVN